VCASCLSDGRNEMSTTEEALAQGRVWRAGGCQFGPFTDVWHDSIFRTKECPCKTHSLQAEGRWERFDCNTVVGYCCTNHQFSSCRPQVLESQSLPTGILGNPVRKTFVDERRTHRRRCEPPCEGRCVRQRAFKDVHRPIHQRLADKPRPRLLAALGGAKRFRSRRI